jgi:hypothetical protein
MVFIQGKSSQSVNIKMTPTLLMLKKVAYFSILKDEFLNCALMRFPIEIQVRLGLG